MGTRHMHMPRLSAELGAEVRVAWRSDSAAWHQAAASVVRIGLEIMAARQRPTAARQQWARCALVFKIQGKGRVGT